MARSLITPTTADVSVHGGTGRVLKRIVGRPAGVIGLGLTGAVTLVAFLATRLAPHNPFLLDVPKMRSPSSTYPLGTDFLGRDIFSSVILGARTAMTAVVWVSITTILIGVTLGVLAGSRGGWVDDAVTRLADLVQAVPRFFLAIVVTAYFGGELRHLIVLLSLTSWPLLARLVRAEALSVVRREFVGAAQAAGATGLRVMVRHVVPNIVPTALAVVALTASRVVLLESSLSFLGLGDPEVISWGFLLNNARGFLETAWWMAVFPGLAIVLAVLGFNLLSDSLTDALNPLAGEGRSGAE